MKLKKSYLSVVLSVTIVSFVGCGGTSVPTSGDTPDKAPRVSPFVSQTLSPSDMPKFEEGEISSQAVEKVTIKLDKTKVKRNSVITVSLTDMPKQYDWVGLFYKGDASERKNLLSYSWTGNKSNVKLKIANTLQRDHKEKLAAGDYEVRAFTKSGYYVELARTDLTIEAEGGEAQPTITINNTNIHSDESISFTLTNVSQVEGEWIGIFPKGSENKWENSWSWTYTEEAFDDQITLEGVPAGEYDVRLFSDENMDLLTSIPLNVKAQENVNTSISMNKTKYSTAENITVHFTGMPGNSDDWIGIFPEGEAGNAKENARDYFETDGLTNGDITFSGIEAGSFEIRAYHSGSASPVDSQNISIIQGGGDGESPKKVALIADEHDPHNRLLAVDYENMELIQEIQVEGSGTHHADVVGDVENAEYVLMVPKNSTFINVYNVHTKQFVKKIDLPFRPRSADAFNASKNLVLLTAANRPAAVILDATTWEIVGQAGMNVTCNLKFNNFNYHPWYYKNIVFGYKNIPSSEISCVAPDFGGQNISGHPRWLGSKHFAVLDRANRLVEVYRLDRKDKNGQWKISLTDSIRTSTSLHQLIPSGKNDNIYYGMTEGNGNGDGIAPVMYKWRFENGKLKQLAKTSLVTTKTVTIMQNIGAYGMFSNFWNAFKENKSYYEYYYPARFPSRYNKYYPGNADSYYSDYYNEAKNEIVNYQNNYQKQVPVEVQKQFKSLGGHNLYISPAVNGTQYLWGAVASGQAFVVNAETMEISNVVKANTGAGHVTFQHNGKYAVITNHKSDKVTIADFKTQKWVKDVTLPFTKMGISPLLQSHTQYITNDDKYYHDVWTDGGVFFRINLDTLTLDSKTVNTGGIPIQGNYFPNYKGD